MSFSAACGKVEVLQYLVRGRNCACAFNFFSNKVKTGPANPCNNKLIWSGLIDDHAFFKAFVKSGLAENVLHNEVKAILGIKKAIHVKLAGEVIPGI